MEFQTLARRELQSLCKRNNIPANITNIAMADALKSLEIVEGIEEIISQPKESESAESSIESPAKSEVTSPYVPPTGGRTTRQITIAKEEPQTLGPMTRTRGTARKTQAKNKEESRADATETPAVVAQHSRRRVPFASACKKMESQLKECAEEDEKKVVPLTPVALEVTSRRMGLKKASEVRLVYSTRRSARLAEKNVEIRSGVKNDKPEILRSDLFMKEEGENVEMNVKEMSDGEPEGPEITVETSLDENFKKMDGTEVSSGRKQDIPDENDESKPESNVEEILGQHSEIDEPNPEMELCVDAGVEQSSLLYETESELNGERADETELSNGGNVSMTLNESSNDFEDGDGSPDISTFENTTELTTTHKDADEVDLKDTIDYGVKNISLESLDHVKQDEVGEENETNPNPNGGKQASEEEPVGKSLTLTKKSASKANAKAKKIADISAAKENICSCGSKLVLTKDGVKIAKEVAENVDKNMEKLQVTNKSSKDENGNKAIMRPVLQALPENKQTAE